jgi:hypothetical protein
MCVNPLEKKHPFLGVFDIFWYWGNGMTIYIWRLGVSNLTFALSNPLGPAAFMRGPSTSQMVVSCCIIGATPYGDNSTLRTNIYSSQSCIPQSSGGYHSPNSSLRVSHESLPDGPVIRTQPSQKNWGLAHDACCTHQAENHLSDRPVGLEVFPFTDFC